MLSLSRVFANVIQSKHSYEIYLVLAALVRAIISFTHFHLLVIISAQQVSLDKKVSDIPEKLGLAENSSLRVY